MMDYRKTEKKILDRKKMSLKVKCTQAYAKIKGLLSYICLQRA